MYCRYFIERHIEAKNVADNSELSAIIDAQVNMVISSYPATDKQLVKFDLYLSLLSYRTAPMACGKSPSEMLTNCKLRNKLPHVIQNVDIDGRQHVIRQKQIVLYNEHVNDLPLLEPNDVVKS